MKSRSKLFILYCSGALLTLVAFAAGYYKGTLDCARKSTGFALVTNLGMYDELSANRSDLALSSLKVYLWGESRSLHSMKESPLSYFKYELMDAQVGDISKRLEKADVITKDLYR
jgi:hypothetical protein